MRSCRGDSGQCVVSLNMRVCGFLGTGLKCLLLSQILSGDAEENRAGRDRCDHFGQVVRLCVRRRPRRRLGSLLFGGLYSRWPVSLIKY
jgi:hypothetical protein